MLTILIILVLLCASAYAGFCIFHRTRTLVRLLKERRDIRRVESHLQQEMNRLDEEAMQRHRVHENNDDLNELMRDISRKREGGGEPKKKRKKKKKKKKHTETCMFKYLDMR